jgi:hypothetical protein
MYSFQLRSIAAGNEDLWTICRRDENTFTSLVQTYSQITFSMPIVDDPFFIQQSTAVTALSLSRESRS